MASHHLTDIQLLKQLPRSYTSWHACHHLPRYAGLTANGNGARRYVQLQREDAEKLTANGNSSSVYTMTKGGRRKASGKKDVPRALLYNVDDHGQGAQHDKHPGHGLRTHAGILVSSAIAAAAAAATSAAGAAASARAAGCSRCSGGRDGLGRNHTRLASHVEHRARGDGKGSRKDGSRTAVGGSRGLWRDDKMLANDPSSWKHR